MTEKQSSSVRNQCFFYYLANSFVNWEYKLDLMKSLAVLYCSFLDLRDVFSIKQRGYFSPNAYFRRAFCRICIFISLSLAPLIICQIVIRVCIEMSVVIVFLNKINLNYRKTLCNMYLETKFIYYSKYSAKDRRLINICLTLEFLH